MLVKNLLAHIQVPDFHRLFWWTWVMRYSGKFCPVIPAILPPYRGYCQSPTTTGRKITSFYPTHIHTQVLYFLHTHTPLPHTATLPPHPVHRALLISHTHNHLKDCWSKHGHGRRKVVYKILRREGLKLSQIFLCKTRYPICWLETFLRP